MSLHEIATIVSICVSFALLIISTTAFVFALHLWKRLSTEHRRMTYVNTVRGLVNTLEIASRNNTGFPIETRQRIYAAIQEQFEHYDNAIL